MPVVGSAAVGPTDAVAAVVGAAVVVLGESTTVGFIVVTPPFLVEVVCRISFVEL